MSLLPLDSPRWQQLRSHFGNAGEDGELPSVPKLIERWGRAVGTYAEEFEYSDLYEMYLHQSTILDVAFAVVPHLAARLADLPPDRRLTILGDIASVESVRLTPQEEVEDTIAEMRRTLPESLRDQFIQNTRDRHPGLPSDLAPAYFDGLHLSQAAALELIAETPDEDGFRALLAVICTLHGQRAIGRIIERLADEEVVPLIRKLPSFRRISPRHWRRHVAHLQESGWRREDIEFGVAALTAEGEDGALVYHDWDVALKGLRALEDVPAGWFERTRLRDNAGVLGFRALYAVAWLINQVPLDIMIDDV